LLNVGDFEFKVLSTPGHAIGHISFYLDSTNNEFNHPILIAGDALFQGSIGRTDLPGGNYQELINSIRTKLLTLPDNTVVCPGHGQNTTIKYERDTNPFLTN
ncbi:MAG: MBL fold metallo-hydrolase, partial [Candidatus Margulisiibacteriota bacterium]